jgi:hypothetical protein
MSKGVTQIPDRESYSPLHLAGLLQGNHPLWRTSRVELLAWVSNARSAIHSVPGWMMHTRKQSYRHSAPFLSGTFTRLIVSILPDLPILE